MNKNDRHSFIQYILVETGDDGRYTTHTGYVRFDLRDFTYLDEPFAVQIGDSIFTEKFIKIDLKDENFHFKGNLRLGNFHKIKQSLLVPNIMGFFGYIPKMECYHGVISMNHGLAGDIIINDQRVDFTNGRGYLEKDWGTSFPKHYIWLHSNHFTNPSLSLFFSVAHIPFYGTEFEGFICNVAVDGKEYRFASYNRSRCQVLEISDQSVRILLENKNTWLELTAEVSDQGELIAPVQGKMVKTIKEGIGGEIRLRLEDKITGKKYDDYGMNAGVEIVDYK